MTIIDTLFKGLISLSMILLVQQGCSVKEMAGKAAIAHKKGLSSYKDYSKMLTGYQGAWLDE